jgi:hypothetical protein
MLAQFQGNNARSAPFLCVCAVLLSHCATSGSRGAKVGAGGGMVSVSVSDFVALFIAPFSLLSAGGEGLVMGTVALCGAKPNSLGRHWAQ